MTAPRLSRDDIVEANRLAMEIGETFRRARLERGQTLKQVALMLGTNPRSVDNIARFEQGANTNVNLGTIVRNLELFGYTIRVARIRKPRACAVYPTHDTSTNGNARRTLRSARTSQ